MQWQCLINIDKKMNVLRTSSNVKLLLSPWVPDYLTLAIT